MKTTLAVLAVGILAGCATQSSEESSPAPAPSPGSMSTSSSARGAPGTGVAASRSAGVSMPQARSVYYEYDQSTIRADGTKVVDANAQYLREHPDLKIKVEGNADERGSREYNLALGQRRADAVQKRMTILGIPSDRIESVSYGKEKPKATGHDETSWSENRRSDIVYR
ncbi:MAG TPA: peptidoglycan-associated lipoprotein Pal [Burkholderiales bacterium]|nr:peptidoglycan-associated lipoprotein Pal [Burkholderiales bacterium]